jgi:hypothetical protein
MQTQNKSDAFNFGIFDEKITRDVHTFCDFIKNDKHGEIGSIKRFNNVIKMLLEKNTVALEAYRNYTTTVLDRNFTSFDKLINIIDIVNGSTTNFNEWNASFSSGSPKHYNMNNESNIEMFSKFIWLNIHH